MNSTILKIALIAKTKSKEEFTNLLLNQTQKFSKQFENMPPQEEPAPEPILSEKAANVKKLIDRGDFGCRRSEVAELMSVVLGEPITVKDDKRKRGNDFRYEIFGVSIPMVKEGHNYPVNNPVLVYSNDGEGCLINNGEVFYGNCLPREFYKVRPATNDEIKKFASDIYDTFNKDSQNMCNEIIKYYVSNKNNDEVCCEKAEICQPEEERLYKA